jgi:polysaccharide biosynthesis/export protein
MALLKMRIKAMKKAQACIHTRQSAAVGLCFGLGLMLVAWGVPGTTPEASANPLDAPVESADYRLMPGDKLSVVVFDQKDLSGDFVIDGAGEIMLPLAGRAKVAGLTIVGAQQLIEDRLSNGILVHPTVSVKVAEYRPIFVTGYVRKPGNYPFIFGISVKSAIATAGGEGESGEYRSADAAAEADAIVADERVRQLETEGLALLVRKARLEAQRDEAATFVMPQLVGFDPTNVAFATVYSAEDNAFRGLVEAYQSQLKALEAQRPRIEAEIQAVNGQINDVKQRLEIVSQRLAEYEDYAARGYVRKPIVIEQQIQKSLVQAELSRLKAELARLQQNMGDLESRKAEIKAGYQRQILSELQAASQRLLDINATLGTARQLRRLRVQYVGFHGDRVKEVKVRLTRTRPESVTTFDATEDTKLEPGDVVEIRRIQNDLGSLRSTEASLNSQQQPAPTYCSQAAELSTAPNSESQFSIGNNEQGTLSGTFAAAEGQQATAAARQ